MIALSAPTLKRLIPYMRAEAAHLIAAGALMIFGVVLQLPLPLVTRYIIDSILPHKNLHALNYLIIALVVLMIVKGLCDVGHSYVMSTARERMLVKLQADVFRHVQGLDLSFFKNTKSSYLVARVNNDVAQLGSILSGSLLTIMKDAITFVAGACVILFFHAKLAIASILVLPFFIASMRLYSSRIRRCSADYQESFASVWHTTEESFSAISVVKAFQTEGQEQTKVVRALRDRMRAIVNMGLTSSLSGFTSAFIGGLGPLIVLWYGGREVVANHLTLGTLIAFNVVIGYLFGPAQRLMNVNADLQQSLASLERVSELLHITPEITEPSRPIVWNPVLGGIEFQRVTFGYDRNNPILNGISFNIFPSQTIAIVGKNGAGKTTLASLIPRFYDPQAGTILVDGIDIRHLSLYDLRRAIGIVPQSTFLFSGTIRDNIRYGTPTATEDQFLRVAKLAHVIDFVRELPGGFDTEVGERGVKLSGGERQRIAIARAMLRNPSILILDEATSEIDSESEHLIQQALTNLLQNRTTLIIAHRFATLLNADKILVLEAGTVIDQGTHKELYERCPVYQQLCRYQLLSPELEKSDAASQHLECTHLTL